MSEAIQTPSLERQLAELEHITNYTFTRLEYKDWAKMRGEYYGPGYVDWGAQSSEDDPMHQLHTDGAGRCFSGVLFRPASAGELKPVLYHYLNKIDGADDEPDYMAKLRLPPGQHQYGIVGSGRSLFDPAPKAMDSS